MYSRDYLKGVKETYPNTEQAICLMGFRNKHNSEKNPNENAVSQACTCTSVQHLQSKQPRCSNSKLKSGSDPCISVQKAGEEAEPGPS